MPSSILDITIGSSSVASLQKGLSAATASASSTSADTTQKYVVSRSSTTSVTGKVTTVTTYSDGSVKTTVSEGDAIVLTNKKAASA